MKDFSKGIKLATFRGKRDDWRMWSTKFFAFAASREFKEILSGEKKLPDEGSTNADEVRRFKKLNNFGYYCLNYAVEDKVCFSLIDSARTDALPEGDCALARKFLKEKYEPRQAGSKQQLLMEFHSSKLRSTTKSPDKFIAELEHLRYRLRSMGEKLSDEMMINHILCSLPEEYDSKVEHLRHMLDEKKNLTLYQVIEVLRSKFYLISQRSGRNNNLEGDETPALYTKTKFSQGFKGTCYNCGEYGQKSSECPKKNNTNNNFMKNMNNSNRNKNNNFNKNNNYSNNNFNRNNNYSNNNFNKNGDYTSNNRNYNFTNSNSNQFSNQKNNPDANVRCYYCHKLGHRMQDCRKRMKSEQNKRENGMTVKEISNSDAFTLMANVYEKNISSEDITTKSHEQWFGDSGASVHITNNDLGMFNIRPCDTGITIGDGSKLKCEKTGDLKVKVLQKDKKKTLVLKNVRFVPDFICTLFSLTTAMAQNVEIVSKHQHMTLKKGKFSIDFKPICKNKNGFMLGITVEHEFDKKAFRVSTNFPSEPEFIQPTETTIRFSDNPEIIEATARAPKMNQLTINTKKYHLQLGHVCEDTTRLTAKYYGIKLTSKFLPCGDCALAKRTQHRLARAASNPATECGRRMFLDVTEICNLSLDGQKYLAALTDEFSSKKFSMFLKKKSELIPVTIEILQKIYVEYKTTVQKIRMDNAGENLHFQHELNKNPVLRFMGTTIQYTAPYTP